MNIKDLPQGSYTEVQPQRFNSGGLNINNLPQGSYTDVPAGGATADQTTSPFLQGIKNQLPGGSNFGVNPLASKTGRDIALPTLGQLAGEALGAPLAPFTGGASVSVLGGLGAGAGDLAAQGISNIMGEQKGIDWQRTGVTTAVGLIPFGKLWEGAGKIIGSSESGVGKIVSSMIDTLKKGWGLSEETAQTIARDPHAVESTITKLGKDEAKLPIATRAADAANKFSQNTKTSFDKGLEAAKKAYPLGTRGKAAVQEVMNESTGGLPKALRDYRIGVNGDGTLNFNKFPSAIRNPAERSAIQDAYNLIKNQKNFSVQGVQDTAAALNKTIEYVAGDKTVSSAAANAIHDSYSEAIGKAYPELGKVRGTYAAAQKVIDSLKKGVSSGDVAQTLSKITGLMGGDKLGAYKGALTTLKDATGFDMIKELSVLKAAKEISSVKGGSTVFKNVKDTFNSMIGQASIESAKGTIPTKIGLLKGAQTIGGIAGKTAARETAKSIFSSQPQ